MKINWDAKITNFDGVTLKDGEKDVTLATITCSVFVSVLKGDEQLSGEEKEKLFKIGMSAATGGIGEITADQAATLKRRIGIAYPPLIVGRAYEIIEGDSPEAPKLVKRAG